MRSSFIGLTAVLASAWMSANCWGVGAVVWVARADVPPRLPSSRKQAVRRRRSQPLSRSSLTPAYPVQPSRSSISLSQTLVSNFTPHPSNSRARNPNDSRELGSQTRMATYHFESVELVEVQRVVMASGVLTVLEGLEVVLVTVVATEARPVCAAFSKIPTTVWRILVPPLSKYSFSCIFAEVGYIDWVHPQPRSSSGTGTWRNQYSRV